MKIEEKIWYDFLNTKTFNELNVVSLELMCELIAFARSYKVK